jgi:transcription elongation factor GreA
MRRPMTPNGNNALRKELKKLKAMRPELAQAIEIARALGDISENADYDAAKEKSGMIEAKIRDVDNKLTQAEVIDPRNIKNHDRVVFGLSIKIEDIDSGEQKVFHLVGSDESDLTKNRLGFESALAKGLIGKQAGDICKVSLPSGAKEYEIIQIFCGYQPDPEESEAE